MTRDDIIRMAREAGYGDALSMIQSNELERFAALVAAVEREECAKVCEDLDDGKYAGGDQPYGLHYARAIRERGAP